MYKFKYRYNKSKPLLLTKNYLQEFIIIIKKGSVKLNVLDIFA